jgi:hypothetical protein
MKPKIVRASVIRMHVLLYCNSTTLTLLTFFCSGAGVVRVKL